MAVDCKFNVFNMREYFHSDIEFEELRDIATQKKFFLMRIQRFFYFYTKSGFCAQKSAFEYKKFH